MLQHTDEQELAMVGQNWHGRCSRAFVHWLVMMILVGGALAGAARAAGVPLPEIPFGWCNGLVGIEVTNAAAGRKLFFLLDSGAGSSVLDARTAGELRLKPQGQVAVRGVQSQSWGAWAKSGSWQIQRVALPRRWLVVNLDELSHGCGRHIDGLLGVDFFRGRVVEINYAAQMVRLLPAVGPSQNSIVLPLGIRGGALCVPVSVNGSPARWVRLDTGCASALQWVSPLAKSTRGATQTSIGLTPVAAPSTLAKIRLGETELPRIEVGWHERELFPGEAGLLGNGLLSRFRMTVDAVGGQVILERSE